MKYCTHCYTLTNEGDTCACGGKAEECKAQTGVKIASVKGSLKPIVEPALKDKGIPCEFYNPEKDVYTQLNAKISSETEFFLLVPFEFYSEAFDICVGLGIVEPDEKIEVEESTQTTDDKDYDQRFEEATGTKRKSFTVLWIILFIVVGCLVIWGIDLIAALIKTSMGVPVISKFINFL